MNGDRHSFECDKDGVRLDSFLSDKLDDYSRSSIQKLIEAGNVTVNGKTASKNLKLKIGDIIEASMPQPVEIEVLPQNIPLDIVYEDNDLIVVNKPKGMVVHPAAGNHDNTLVNALLYHCRDSLSGINGVIRPGIVHRIDKDTSGLLIVAKNDKAHNGLAAQIKEHSFLREYEAVVCGNIKVEKGIIDAPIGRNKQERKKMCVCYENSKDAVTEYEVIARYQGYTHILCRLRTGRTHQIRVHMAYIGHPVAGDTVYGGRNVVKALNGQCLHARTIGFIHPITGEEKYFKSELPKYFTDFLSKLKRSE